MIDVSIIFVNYKTKDLTINAIKSVKEKTKNLDYEIIVVDNNSQDGSIEEIEKTFQDINIIKNHDNSGFGSANNIAIKNAKGKYVFCLNTDTLLVNNAIKIMFDFMEQPQNSNVAVCGGYLTDINNIPIPCGGNFPSIIEILWKLGLKNIFPKIYNKYSLILNSDYVSKIQNVDYISGADIFIRKSSLDIVGLFDENIFMYFEETDLCKRIKNMGFDIKFVNNAKIIHLEGKSIKNTIQKLKWSKCSEFYYFRKHHENQVLIIKILYSFIYFISGYILKNKNSKDLFDYIKQF